MEKLFSEKSVVCGKWVAIMDYARQDRGIILTAFRTRCLTQHEIHEFIVCGPDVIPNKPIDKVAYLGFGEITEGGVVEIGDSVYSDKRLIGTILGFDETHVPNHYNVIIKMDTPLSGHTLGLKLAEFFSIHFGKNNG